MATTPAAAAAATGGFALGIAPEDKLSMPLDALIKSSKAANKAKATTNKKNKKPLAKAAKSGAAPLTKQVRPRQRQQEKKAAVRQQLNVKKTVTVPVSKAARARATTKASSTKRQAEINKRRPGLVVPPKASSTKRPVQVQVRRQQTSALRVARAAATGPASAAGKRRRAKAHAPMLDVSNIQHHFATHPTKFDLPNGTVLRITVNLNKVKPVVGTKK